MNALMNEKKLVSVIIPIYNLEKYIDKCISSVVKQTYANIEIVLVDDASTDESNFICNKWVKNDDRVKLIYHDENQGLSSARNSGIKNAKGEYVAFIDGDDYVESEFIETLVNNIENSDVCVVGFTYESEKGLLYRDTGNDGQRRLITQYQAYDEVFNGGIDCYVWNKLYRKELLDQTSQQFNKDVYWAEDVLFLCQHFRSVSSVCFVNKCLYHYIKREGSAVNSTFNSRKMSFLDAYNESIEILNDYSYQDIKNAAIVSKCLQCQRLIYIAYNSGLNNIKNTSEVIKKLKKEIFKNLFVILRSRKHSFKQKALCVLISMNVPLGCLILKKYKENMYE